MSLHVRCLLVLALFTTACGSGGGSSPGPTSAAPSAKPPAEAPSTPSSLAPAAAPLSGEPEVFARISNVGLSFSLSDTALYFSERVDEGERIDRIVRVPLDAPGKREEIAKGKLLNWTGQGDHLLMSAYEEETARLVNGATKKSHTVGSYTDAAWDRGAVYVARPAGDKPEVLIEAITLGDAPAPKRIGVIPKSDKLSASPNSMAVSSTHVFVALDEDGPATRTPCHVFALPIGGGDAKDIGTITNLHQLAVVGGELYVGSLAQAHKLEPSGTLASVEGMHWDFLTSDGKVAYYFVSTSLPQGGIGGYLYTWTPPAEPQRIYERLRDPNYVAMNKTHVYWLNGDSEILRIPREPGR